MSEVRTWRSKPTVVEARQVPCHDDNHVSDIARWCNGWVSNGAVDDAVIAVPGYEMVQYACPGDYIVKDRHGRFTVRNPGVFEARYVLDDTRDSA